MSKFILPLFILIISGCTQQPRMSAWEHLQTALELDEASVVEYMALDYLPEIIGYDNTSALREAIHASPDDAIDWMLDNYRSQIISSVAADMPAEFIPSLLQRHGDIVLHQLFTANPDLIAAAAAQYDPYLTFDKAFQRDPDGILRRAIDQNPRYAAQYIRNFHGELQ